MIFPIHPELGNIEICPLCAKATSEDFEWNIVQCISCGLQIDCLSGEFDRIIIIAKSKTYVFDFKYGTANIRPRGTFISIKNISEIKLVINKLDLMAAFE